jgi:predicted esterase
MKQFNKVVRKTARYFQLGEFTAETRHVWLVCHGYGQLASYFLKKFECIAAPDTVIIAPEGLHRFYTDGTGGRVGASWMTKEDRLDDIRDYIYFLDELDVTIMANLRGNAVNYHVLGFSQGGATAARWLATSKLPVDTLILWCAFFPPDVDWNTNTAAEQTKTHIVLASDDVYISEADAEKQLQQLRDAGLPFTTHRFEGKHTVDAAMLKQLAAELRD